MQCKLFTSQILNFLLLTAFRCPPFSFHPAPAPASCATPGHSITAVLHGIPLQCIHQCPASRGSGPWAGGHCIPGPPAGAALRPHETGWNHTQPHVTEGRTEQGATRCRSSTAPDGSPPTWALSTDLQPELKTKPGAHQDVFFIKTETIYRALLEPKCQYNMSENVSFYVPLMPPAPGPLRFLCLAPGTRARKHSEPGAGCTPARL